MKVTNGNSSGRPWVLLGEQQARTEVQVVPAWLELRADGRKREVTPTGLTSLCASHMPSGSVPTASFLAPGINVGRTEACMSSVLSCPAPSLVPLSLEEPFADSTANSNVTFLQKLSLVPVLVISAGLRGLSCHHRVPPHRTCASRFLRVSLATRRIQSEANGHMFTNGRQFWAREGQRP